MGKEYIVIETFKNKVAVMTDDDGFAPLYFDTELNADKYGNENTECGYIVAMVVHSETASD